MESKKIGHRNIKVGTTLLIKTIIIKCSNENVVSVYVRVVSVYVRVVSVYVRVVSVYVRVVSVYVRVV